MFVTVRVFARLRDLTGQSELSRELPAGATAGSVWETLVQDFPALADYGRTAPIPDNNMSWEQAATYLSALGTMHDAIVTNARLQRGETNAEFFDSMKRG